MYGNEKTNQIRHTSYDDVSMHRPFIPRIKNGQDAGSCHDYGFAVITSLLKEEERMIYAGRDDAEIVIPYNMSMILLGNYPHGGVTHCVDEDCDLIWPALHVNIDISTRPRCPFLTGDVPTGYGTLDNDDELDDSVGKAESVSGVTGGSSLCSNEDDRATAQNVSAAAKAGVGSEEIVVNDVIDAKCSDVDGAGNTNDEEDAEEDGSTAMDESNTDDEEETDEDGSTARDESVRDSEGDKTPESSSDADEDDEEVEDADNNEESTALSNDMVSNHDSDPKEAEHAPEQECSSEEESATSVL